MCNKRPFICNKCRFFVISVVFIFYNTPKNAIIFFLFLTENGMGSLSTRVSVLSSQLRLHLIIKLIYL